MDVFSELLLSHRALQFQIGPQIRVGQFYGTPVTANNPYNPFGEDVNVSFAYPGAGQRENQSASLVRPIVGIRGALVSGLALRGYHRALLMIACMTSTRRATLGSSAQR